MALAIAALASSASAKSPKRGVSEDSFSIEKQMSVLEPGVSWYYNWSAVPGKGYQSQVVNYDGYEFIPMAWNGNFDEQAMRDYLTAHPEVKYLLGFNEPNFTKQANMTPAAAAENWPRLQAIAKDFGLKLVAPAMNYSPNAPYQDPTKWFDEFVALVGPDAFDFVAIHNYGGLGVMKTLAGTFHERYGKDVWVTEFCYWPEEGNANARVEPDVQIQSMVETVEWLEKTPWIYRYAWFKPIGIHENTATSWGPCYGLIISENGLGDRKLSPQGYVYLHMSDFDPERWHECGSLVPASEYSAQNGISLAPGSNPEAPKPIEISRFSAGAWADYQIDVPETDTYTLSLTVSGKGEPVRFDPTLAIELVDGDNTSVLSEARKYTLSGDDAIYTVLKFDISLESGHRTIRIHDTAPSEPSGIRLSTLRIDPKSSVADILADSCDSDADDKVYSIDGLPQNPDCLAPGIYIRSGKKFVVK